MLFADDAKLFSTNSQQLQINLTETDNWLKSHQLNYAINKCFHLQVSKPRSKPQPTEFYLNNTKISRCNIIKDLGIHISHDLKWSHYVNYLFKIGSLTSYQILKSFKSKNIWTLLNLYTTYCRPKLEYNSSIWNPYYKKDILKLESVQRSFTRRACLRCGIPFTSYRDRLMKLNIKSLQYRRLVSDLILLYKIVNGLSHLNFANFFISRDLSYNLRGSKNKISPLFNFKNTQWSNSFFNKVTMVWNALPDNITACKSLPAFKLNIKKYNLENFLDSVF